MVSLLLSVYFMDDFIEVRLTRPVLISTINAHLTCNSLTNMAGKMSVFFSHLM